MSIKAEHRTISTGLSGNVYHEILESMIGQLSDGIWENSSRMDPYWQNLGIKKDDNGDLFILVNSIGTPFDFMDDFNVKEWCANKIKQIVKREEKDNGCTGWWKRDNTQITLRYLGYHEKVAVADAYHAYDVLKERSRYM